jgi:hypothetical protein
MFNPSNFNAPEPGLLKTLLEPLLEDFQYWFGRSRTLLESQEIEFLGEEKQSDLLERVKQAQQQVSTAQLLMKATDNQVGVETSVLMPWHHLVTECWQVAIRFRLENPIE